MNRHRTVTENGTPKDAVCKVLSVRSLRMRRVGIEPTTYRFNVGADIGGFRLFPLENLRIIGRNLQKRSIGRASDRNQTVISFLGSIAFDVGYWIDRAQHWSWT